MTSGSVICLMQGQAGMESSALRICTQQESDLYTDESWLIHRC
jgi:hypothetical protein